MGRRLAAVTGATGFLGRFVVRELAHAGWDVRVLSRRDVIHPLWREIEVEVVPGDLADEAALARLCHGADVVVHGAGLIKARTRAAFDVVNVEGARRVALAASSPVVLISSLAAREPQLSDYAASKRAGEAAARAILGETLSVVRPPALYGPGDVETLSLFAAAAASPLLPVLSSSARVAMMHVEDAARQVAALADGPFGATLALSDLRPDGYTWPEIMRTAAGVFGRSPSLFPLPAGVLRFAANLGRWGARDGRAPMLSPGKARELLHPDWSVAPHEQANLPPPHYDLASGFLDAVQGYRAGGVVFGNRRQLAKPVR